MCDRSGIVGEQSSGCDETVGFCCDRPVMGSWHGHIFTSNDRRLGSHGGLPLQGWVIYRIISPASSVVFLGVGLAPFAPMNSLRDAKRRAMMSDNRGVWHLTPVLRTSPLPTGARSELCGEGKEKLLFFHEVSVFYSPLASATAGRGGLGG